MLGPFSDFCCWAECTLSIFWYTWAKVFLGSFRGGVELLSHGRWNVHLWGWCWRLRAVFQRQQCQAHDGLRGADVWHLLRLKTSHQGLWWSCFIFCALVPQPGHNSFPVMFSTSTLIAPPMEQSVWIWAPALDLDSSVWALPVSGCLALGKSLNSFDFEFLHLTELWEFLCLCSLYGCKKNKTRKSLLSAQKSWN